ncbi:hypothetical protein ADIS_1955 [Lunatimonas lonarensis]|uniref:Uncharacterized protein n=1 Tax=Lunatimonas lonarensis TaxID=1232681 RepID=R7ZTZ1_9BACT|nr:hypothetical protein ADIS_1955 [Lunatimonas lonarensis]
MNLDESHRKSKIGNYSRVKKFRLTRLPRILETVFWEGGFRAKSLKSLETEKPA